MAGIRLKCNVIQRAKKVKRFDSDKLKDDKTRNSYEIEICGRFNAVLGLQDDVDTEWNNIKNALTETAKKVLGYKKA